MAPAPSDIHDLLRSYLDDHPAERDALLPLLDALASPPGTGDHTALPDAITLTCSAVVVDDARHVLRVRRLGNGNRFLLPGGPVGPGDATLVAAALRALHEQTGITPGVLSLTTQFLGAPIDITVDDRGPAQQRYDLRFVFCLADGRSRPVVRHEDTGAQWLPFDQADSPALRAKLEGCAVDGRSQPVNAAALIHDDEGRYLLHLRDNYPGIWAPGEFSLLGGGRERKDRSLEETLLRELAEEVPGLVLADLEPFAVEQAVGVDGLCVPIQTFASRWDGDPASLVLTEGVLLHWFRPDDLHRLRIRPSTRDLIQRHARRIAAVPRARMPETASDNEPVLNGVGAHLYLQDDQGRVLLGLRHPDCEYAGNTWHFLAGGCEQEPVRDAVAREAREEAGLVIDPDDLELVHTVHLIDYPGARPLMEMVFRARRWSGSPRLMEPDRCLAWQWWDPNALPEPIVAYTRAAIEGIQQGRPYTQMGWTEQADAVPLISERPR